LGSLKEFPGVKNFSQEELTAISFLRIKEAQNIALKWFAHGEYLEVEIDTEKKTCIVVPVDEYA